VLIVGANFAGLAASRRLAGHADVTAVDRGRWFEWLPNVHELVSGVKTPEMLRADRRRIVGKHGNRFLLASIRSLDAGRGLAITERGRRIRFDACIAAVGGEDETFGVPGAHRHAMPFKSVDECLAIGRRLRQLARSKDRLRIVIVGAGLEGVEALGEILRRHRDRPNLEITVVDGARRVMAGMPVALHRAIAEHCREHDVRLLIDRRVVRVTPRRVMLADATALVSDLTIWTGGVRAPTTLTKWGLSSHANGWAEVDRTLRCQRAANVFVAGDAASLPKALPKQAYHALDMGAHAAENLLRACRGQRPLAFRPAPKPTLIAFGDLDTFLVTGKTVLASPALAIVKEAVFQLTMARIDPPADSGALGDLQRRAAGAVRRALQGGVGLRDLRHLLDTRLLAY
jgi:NADH dehydrogenase